MKALSLILAGHIMAFLPQLTAQIDLSIKMTPALTLNSPIGDYQIQKAKTLGGATNWITITNVTLTGSPFTFYDNTAGGSQQFYRAIKKELPENPYPQKLIWIPPGTFMMGSPLTNEDSSFCEGPQTRVTITQGFWMSKYKVTQEEYLSVMGSNPSYFTDDLNRPVEQVHWHNATNYCLNGVKLKFGHNRLDEVAYCLCHANPELNIQEPFIM